MIVLRAALEESQARREADLHRTKLLLFMTPLAQNLFCKNWSWTQTKNASKSCGKKKQKLIEKKKELLEKRERERQERSLPDTGKGIQLDLRFPRSRLRS